MDNMGTSSGCTQSLRRARPAKCRNPVAVHQLLLFGISGEQGDLVQFEGQTDTARVLSIDYGTNTLSLDASLTWNAGDGVSLAYTGSAPDVGL